MIAKVNGVELYYEKTGAGRPLLMVHGNGEDHSIFNEAVKELKRDFCCYTVDSRGHGRSSRVPTLHYEDMADDMIAFMEALNLRDAVFYGFSDGGVVGLIAASRCARITTLIVSGANLSPKGVARKIRLSIWAWNLLKPDDKLALMLREPQISEDTLRAIRAETLVLAGSGDLILPEETRRIAAGIPGAKLQIVQGEDHGSYIVHSTRIAAIIREFVLA
ncbi:MAG: alpha/beta hydrolase [Oscillospiraceae bacterium]|nr:alpha/beta hydrolase [Oscillospiraceae bacterium]